MGQKIICECGKWIVVDDSLQGSSIKCPNCGARVPVGESSESPIPIAGTRGPERPRRARRRRSRSRLVPAIGALVAVVLGVLVWPTLSRWMSADSAGQSPGQSAEQKSGAPVEGSNPFAHAQNLAPANNSGGVNGPGPTGRQGEGNDKTPTSKGTAAAAPAGAPPGLGQPSPVGAPPGMAPAPPGMARRPDAAGTVNDEADKQAAERVAKLASLIENVEPCLVRLEVVSASGNGWASGFVVDDGGTIVSNFHLVEAAQTITATWNDNTQLAIEGFKHIAPAKDLAVLQTATPDRKLPFLRLAKKDPVKKDGVVAFGEPMGTSFSASEGIVNGIRTGKKPGELAELGADLTGIWAQITAQVSSDNSGGPLVNRAGEVVGVNTMTLAAEQNQNFAVSRDELRLGDRRNADPAGCGTGQAAPRQRPAQGGAAGHRLPSHVRRSHARRRRDNPDQIGFVAAGIGSIRQTVGNRLVRSEIPRHQRIGPPSRRTAWEGSGRTPVRAWSLTSCLEGSPASGAGLQKDDLIGAIDGKAVVKSGDVEKLVDQFKAGQDVKVSVLRPQPKSRYSKKLLTVRIESLVAGRALDHVASAGVPVEVRDFLDAAPKLRYAKYCCSKRSIRRSGRIRAGRRRPAANSPRRPPAECRCRHFARRRAPSIAATPASGAERPTLRGQGHRQSGLRSASQALDHPRQWPSSGSKED